MYSVISLHNGKIDVARNPMGITVKCPVDIIYEHPLNIIISIVQPSVKVHRASFMDVIWVTFVNTVNICFP